MAEAEAEAEAEVGPSPIVDTDRGWAKAHIDEYLSGTVPQFRHGAPVALVTTKGRTSGIWRRTALIGMDDGNRVILVASGGGDSYPAWYLNLTAEPRVWVQKDRRESWMRARTADATERAELWPKLVAIFPDYADYEANTERDIPVILLDFLS